MKIFFVTGLLAGGVLSVMISLDILMGLNPHGIVWKEINPFRVMEPAEYIIVLIFTIFFLLKSVGSYIKKKRQNSSTSN